MSKDEGGPNSAARNAELRGLVSMKMIHLFALLRRSGLLAQKRLFDLSEIEWRIMVQLGYTAPLSLNGLADALVQDRGQLSRAVKGMVARGLVTRERKPGGPEIEIDLSDDGKLLHGKMIKLAVDRDLGLTDGIDGGALATVIEVTEVMISRAEAMLDREQQAGT
ncbi:MarR family transcriptional regulator [Altererythrobacter salegens]|uniref:MarR family transcriptional regulator n=1 Tax=Croceibacterium salegens TaxID=1737568 RepID=A0A6I4SZJ8_9SPHN|nr:helix-turn-helix domain-containing protein [Croceibacterium salegens]MXO59712.1 MarR family transcriptional regulator [Croceibacterium salegens]